MLRKVGVNSYNLVQFLTFSSQNLLQNRPTNVVFFIFCTKSKYFATFVLCCLEKNLYLCIAKNEKRPAKIKLPDLDIILYVKIKI